MRHVDLPGYDKIAFARKYGPWAVIAGASEGTGLCFAEQLAAMGINIVLVSRRFHLLEEIGLRLAREHGVEFRAISADLKEPGTGARLVEATASLDVGLYVSNAGTDGAGDSFLHSPVARAHELLTMNAGNFIDAVHGFGNRFKQRGGGGVLVMASCAGLGGQPWLVMYAATKAFEMNFAESLWAELKDDNVDVLAVGAPAMDTPTLRRGVAGTAYDIEKSAYVPAEIVHVALATLGHEPLVIFADGPGEEKTPRILADRIERIRAFREWSKAYTGR